MIASTQNSFSEDLVPVVISAYNHQQYVQKTLQSVLDQTYPRIELIIVNDGSTDHTHDRIQDMLPEMQKRMQRVEYRNKANEGVIRSLNLCLSLAKGQYVYFIASDDVAKPEAIEFNNDDEKRRTVVAGRAFYHEHFSGQRVVQFMIETSVGQTDSHDDLWQQEVYK
jgi:alpha-1,3-rhamnosyltransferase